MSGRRSSNSLEMLLMSMMAHNDGLSGYQLAGLLKKPIPFIWPVKHSQIYPALARLEKRGDLKSSWIEQTGRPDKKIYTISSQGLSALVLWLEMARTELTEDEVMLIVYNQGLIESEIVSTALNTYRYQCVREKSDLEERWLEYSDRKAGDESRLSHVRAVYEFAFKSRDARIAWCDQLIEGLINNEKARPLN